MQRNCNHIIDCLHTTIHIGTVPFEVNLLHKMRPGNHNTITNKVSRIYTKISLNHTIAILSLYSILRGYTVLKPQYSNYYIIIHSDWRFEILVSHAVAVLRQPKFSCCFMAYLINYTICVIIHSLSYSLRYSITHATEYHKSEKW